MIINIITLAILSTSVVAFLILGTVGLYYIIKSYKKKSIEPTNPPPRLVFDNMKVKSKPIIKIEKIKEERLIRATFISPELEKTLVEIPLD